MSVLGKLFGAAINVVCVPVAVVVDLAMTPADAADGKDFLSRATKQAKAAAAKISAAADEAAE